MTTPRSSHVTAGRSERARNARVASGSATDFKKLSSFQELLLSRHGADATGREPALALTGAAGLRPVSEATAWVRAIVAPQGRAVAQPAALIAHLRRFPNPRCDRGPLYDAVREPFSLVDIGDLLLYLGGLTSDGRLGTHLLSAAEILGTAVRDAGLLQDLLTALPQHDTYHGHGTVIALAALGVVVDPAEVVRDAYDRRGLDAYAIALGVAPHVSHERRARLEPLRTWVGLPLREWATELIERAEAGETVALAM